MKKLIHNGREVVEVEAVTEEVDYLCLDYSCGGCIFQKNDLSCNCDSSIKFEKANGILNCSHHERGFYVIYKYKDQ